MPTKHCYTCQETKPVSMFYKCGSHGDGLASRCKDCDNRIRRRWALENPQKERRIQVSSKVRRRSEIQKQNKDWALANPEKTRVRSIVYYAVMSGQIKRPSKCSKCKKQCKPEAHHRDYSKPLEVVWVCRPCHRKEDHVSNS